MSSNSFNESKLVKPDNFTELDFNEFAGSFIVDSTSDCFKVCVNDFSENQVSSKEKQCLVDCYAKYNYSYISMYEMMNSTIMDMNNQERDLSGEAGQVSKKI